MLYFRVRIISLKACPSEFKRTYPEVGHEERNEKLGRPQSPHLSIYKAQLTSTLSIMHRTSGIVLCSYIWAFGIGISNTILLYFIIVSFYLF